jgi:hypothetical protein
MWKFSKLREKNCYNVSLLCKKLHSYLFICIFNNFFTLFEDFVDTLYLHIQYQ